MGNQTQQHIGRTQQHTATTTEMNKLILCGSLFFSLLLLLPSTSAEKETGEFLADLCAKCNYCTTENADNKCTGCAKCSELLPSKEKPRRENADFAREKNPRRHVWRGARKDAGFVQARMETGLIVARREEDKICQLSLLLNIKMLQML